ncbi:MAG: amidase [Crocosphaera sp.]|nr:amidase [Crocosphaera sp.]
MKLTSLSAHTLAKIIRERQVSCEAVVKAYLERISRYNPQLNAIVTLDKEQVYQQAKKADRALAKGECLGSLHGVPITIKDSLETKGLKTTCSYEPLANYIPKKDAKVVAKLKAAGAIILGKTNTPKLTRDFQTNSPLFGRANNPWNLDYTPGGSTGGGAAAIAAQLSVFDIGSDLGGSLRVPAHFCGIYTLKPTEKRVSTYGHIPELPGNPLTIKHCQNVGPLGRSVEDLMLCFSVIEEKNNQKLNKKIDSFYSLDYYHFIWSYGFGNIPCSSETKIALKTVIKALSALHCNPEYKELFPINMDEVWDVYKIILTYEFNESPPECEHRKYIIALEKRQLIMNQLALFFEKADVWLTPVVPMTAFPHCPFGSDVEIEGKSYAYLKAIGAYTSLFNLTGYPVVVIPLTLSSKGLPIGIQLVGNYGKDEKLLNIANQISKIIKPLPCPLKN